MLRIIIIRVIYAYKNLMLMRQGMQLAGKSGTKSL